MTWGIELKPDIMPGYVLATIINETWFWVRPEDPRASRYDSHQEAENALTLLPLHIRRDAAICEFAQVHNTENGNG